MIPNTNDGTQKAPYLRCDINAGTFVNLPPESSGPHGDERTLLETVKRAGYAGVQGANQKLLKELGLGSTTGGRVDKVGQADTLAARAKDDGHECVTLHVGNGLEDESTILSVCEDIIKASERRGIGLYVETHRATITQDIWRTVQLAKKLPEIRFNGDFSHWYTGLEMVYGGVEVKCDFAAPVFERVRFIHGRIGNPGSMQVDVGDGSGRTYVDHFKDMWTRCFKGFLKSARPGDYICFAPELLPPKIYYARTIKGADGVEREECDRWQQALVYTRIAKECFEAAKRAV
jgi:hypothetical protein